MLGQIFDDYIVTKDNKVELGMAAEVVFNCEWRLVYTKLCDANGLTELL